jgi:NitT/TauT family transport system substrate-binding protein
MHRLWNIAFVLLAALLLVFGAARARAADAPPDTLRLSVNPSVFLNLPFFMAVDEGYYTEQHLNVETRKNPGQSSLVIPSLVRGDLDVSPLVASPSLYNQFADGFDAKLVASVSEVHTGWDPMAWFVVRQDLWDSKAIRTMADLKGKRIEAGAPGGEGNYLSRLVLAKAGLAESDVHLSQRTSATSDMYTVLYNKAADVVSAYEPTVAELEQKGIGHRLLSIADIDPGFQETYIAISPAYLKNHRDALRRFLTATLKAYKEINDAGGKWTPPMIASLAKWSGLSPEIIARLPAPPYYGAFGAINVGNLVREQKYWIAAGLVKKETPVGDMVDTTLIVEAKRAAGIRRR